jgi:cytidine deaminase
MTQRTDPALLELHAAAEAARSNAYAPYSRYAVGAALRTRQGQRFIGVNVENASFSLTMCAERVALGAAIAAGYRDFDAIAIAADGPTASPCGACRQALAEFAPELRVLFPLDGSLTVMTIEELLPSSFGGDTLAQALVGDLTAVA